MKYFGLVGGCLLILASPLHAADSFPPEFTPTPLKRAVPDKDPYYGPPEVALRKLLSFEKKNRRTNHFCVIGYAWPNDGLDIWVHWVEEKRLLQWRGFADQERRETGLITAQADFRLGKNTVATPDDINGRNDVVTGTWWRAVVDDCAEHGEHFTIRPFKQ
ncbi:hypothetical protein LJ656_13130 [Paraburkholderia sp. MMS20-SJTR3]|uniref:Uncharacterized protein n=1 Tax=Paraburkholderia sejongensis TaxID=2886946 RepID=A0ABS8JUG3_9BURK|nr:hypothetical protein [Paraburkholderia sp. MMS20-SJTR3]MCC8393536.1 hypothetical protein [Paraburkholderia sp. MMS20-SJTR3]